ncbi:MAG: hypothetical protein RQ760_15460, partial [Sedimentisphaerales bacterium]|nr:hypothetical protein [Sedimentisphaerales bacterium]
NKPLVTGGLQNQDSSEKISKQSVYKSKKLRAISLALTSKSVILCLAPAKEKQTNRWIRP